MAACSRRVRTDHPHIKQESREDGDFVGALGGNQEYGVVEGGSGEAALVLDGGGAEADGIAAGPVEAVVRADCELEVLGDGGEAERCAAGTRSGRCQ